MPTVETGNRIPDSFSLAATDGWVPRTDDCLQVVAHFAQLSSSTCGDGDVSVVASRHVRIVVNAW